MSKKIILIVFIIAFAAFSLFAQKTNKPVPQPTPAAMPTPDATPLPPPDINTIVSEASKQTENYRQAFKNLIAVETKTFTKFDKSGDEEDEPQTVESDFLVYQSAKDADSISELRNVTKVNGKPVPDSQKRTDALLAELQKASTLRKELEKIEKESLRYDKTLIVSGFTLAQATVLRPKFQPYVDFKMVGTENYPDGDVYIISYLQTKKSPLISLNSKDAGEDEISEFDISLPGALKKSDPYLRGKLWIDAKTFRIRREQRELFVMPENPIVLMQTDLEYQPSDYDIFTPKRIVVTAYEVKKKDKTYAASKDIEEAFDYSKFRKTETDVKILDDDQ